MMNECKYSDILMILVFVAQLRRRGGAACDDVGEGGGVSLL